VYPVILATHVINLLAKTLVKTVSVHKVNVSVPMAGPGKVVT